MTAAHADRQTTLQEVAATATNFAARIAAASTTGLTLESDECKTSLDETLVSTPTLVFDLAMQKKTALLEYIVNNN